MALPRLRHGLIVALLLFSNLLLAGEPLHFVSEKEFRALAEELATKVNLFSEAWQHDPEAEFYGGTTRDYLYWLKGQLRHVRSEEEAREVIEHLRSLLSIDFRDFIIGDSDIDVIGKHAILPAFRGNTSGTSFSNGILHLSLKLGDSGRSLNRLPAKNVGMEDQLVSAFLDLLTLFR